MPNDNPTIPCLRCGDPFERPRRGRPAKYCPACRKAINVEKQRDRDHAVDADKALIRSVADNLREYLDPSHYVHVDEYIAALGIQPGTAGPIVPDRQPVGTFTPQGSDDGMSTTWPDLQADLDMRAREAAEHQWFKDNPHWAHGL